MTKMQSCQPLIFRGLFSISLAYASSSFGMDLSSLNHVHGIAPGFQQGVALVVAAHDGLYQVQNKDGLKQVQKVGADSWDIMSLDFNAKGEYLGSGHPTKGGNTGLRHSIDGGQHWTQQSLFSKDVVTSDAEDFHFLAVSRADPNWIYGQYKTLKLSQDGGRKWEDSGQLPDKVLSIAASSLDKNTLYAGTEQGLLRSEDRGKNWAGFANIKFPVTAVNISFDGQMTLFEAGKGILRFAENKPDTKTLFNGFGIRYLRFIRESKGKLWGVDQLNTLWVSQLGTSWKPYQPPIIKSSAAKQGEALFNQTCAGCHGQYGVGESYTETSMTTAGYRMAPSLDWTMHAWHHTDENLENTIQEGLKDTRMPAWKDSISVDQTQSIIAYMKSLWRPHELNCQGPKHMSSECI